LFSDKEQLALRFAEQATRAPARVSDELVVQLRQHFSEGEVVELAAVVGLMNFTNKVHEALALPLEEKFLHYSSTKPPV
jgi:alkylhydroperoxidase family enzyme